MKFENHQLYHIYNQGNNRRRIFFQRKNYLFFVEKIKRHILPYADILAWCLMPNHFHFMIYVKTVELPIAAYLKTRTLNESIGIMLRSYTRAINLQQGFSGSLFRKETKASCLSEMTKITPAFINSKAGTKINIENIETQYPKTCFRYIHANPTKAGLVQKDADWEYSSARDYNGSSNDGFVNKNRTLALFDFES